MAKKAPRLTWLHRLMFVTASILILTVVAGGSLGIYKKTHIDDRLDSSSVRTTMPNFDHIVIIMEENHGNKLIVGNPNAGYINYLIKNYAFAKNYFALGHPSVPNYLYLTSASNGGIVDDCNPPSDACNANVPNIADRIEASGRTWKAYMEGMPRPCEIISSGLYDNEHNPFIYYRDILNNKQRCESHDVPLTQLDNDIQNNSLPNYVFISPNLCNDMHNCKEDASPADKWLKKMIRKLLATRAFTQQNSLLVITWDEDANDSAGKVPAILIGKHVKTQYISTTLYNHFSLLRTVEEAWGFKPFNDNDKYAPVMLDFFKP